MMERIRRAQQEDGFTLIEVLVVISILGVLAGIVVFSVSGINDRGQANACKTEKATVNTAIQAYIAKNGTTTAPTIALLTSSPDQFLAESPTWYDISGGKASVKLPAPAGCT